MRPRSPICLLLSTAGWLVAALAIDSCTAPAATPPNDDEAIPRTGHCPAELVSFDDLMLRFLREHDLPGAALAVARNGRLLAARGYGWADRESRQPVEPSSLFRIASISKPLTAVAVLQLAERGQLDLAAKFWDILQPEPLLETDARVDPRQRDITVLQLLRHTAGFDRDQSFDPMFRGIEIARATGVQPPAGPSAIIRYMSGRPLDYPPGERYAYSNYGYCLLGRIIEKTSDTGYEDYVKRSVLGPLGIRDMKLGNTLASERVPDEVRYYTPGDRTAPAILGPQSGSPVPVPYGAWFLEAMDAHGGWLASAVDLVRFAAAFDDPARCPVLGTESVELMFARPEGHAGFDEKGQPLASYYGCGWKVRPRPSETANHWHAGSLPGTATLLVRRHDGLIWAVLFNQRSNPKGERIGAQIDRELHEAANAVESWPPGEPLRPTR